MKRRPSHALLAPLICSLLAASLPVPLAPSIANAARHSRAFSPSPAPRAQNPSDAHSKQAQPTPTPAPPRKDAPTDPTGEDDVVRITTNLVQVDAVVTDKQGRTVVDLAPDEFEIWEDGRPQKITNFSFISTQPNAQSSVAPLVAARPKANKSEPPVPPARLRPEQVRRIVVLVVDDLNPNMSAEAIRLARQALQKYVEEQVQPGDLVAVVRTRGGTGVLQRLTADKRQLRAAIENVRWNPRGGGTLTGFDPINMAAESEATALDGRRVVSSIDEQRRRAEGERFRQEYFTVAALSALASVVRNLREFPGRKEAVLISPGFRVDESRVLDEVRRVADLASRASVVLHAIDVRGLEPVAFTAADSTSTPMQGGSWRADRLYNAEQGLIRSKRDQVNLLQDGLRLLAEEAGGLAVINTNDIAGGIRHMVNEQKGYYLIGYRPAEDTFDALKGRDKFHQIKVRVKRDGLLVRTRRGFYGYADTAKPAPPKTREAQLMSALLSPFAAAQIDLRLTSLFNNEADTGSYMRSLLHLDARSLTFTEEAAGARKAVIDVIAVTLGGGERIVDAVNLTQTIEVRADVFERLLRDGLDYVINVPVKQPGAYQLRVAVRDTATERTGSANQFIEVPDLSKNRLALSGIAISGSATDGAESANAAQGSPSVRRLRQGMMLDYGFVAYNAHTDARAPRPQLETQVRLFRDGQPVYEGAPKPFDPTGQSDLRRLVVGGRLKLGAELAPGEYVLQLVVTDLLADKQHRTATQWIDFEIVK